MEKEWEAEQPEWLVEKGKLWIGNMHDANFRPW